MPTVSVIIPTFNYAHYIAEAVESVLRQTYPANEIEIIVIDDGSTDNTNAVLQPYIDKGLVRYFFQLNRGKANATSVAIQKSYGKYIFNLDADDFYDEQKIGATVKLFEQYNDVVHVASPARFMNLATGDESVEKLPESIVGKPIDGNWLLHFFYVNNILFGGGSTYAARSSVLKNIIIPDKVDMYIDEFLVLAILPYGNSYFFDQPLSTWRVHKTNFSGTGLSVEARLQKETRLLDSSKAILNYLEHAGSDPRLLSIYRLQHATRTVAFKEKFHTKKLSDIWKYGSEVFFKIQPAWELVKNYHVLNRLIPTNLLGTLRLLKMRVRQTG